jgi:hypothetical protein
MVRVRVVLVPPLFQTDSSSPTCPSDASKISKRAKQRMHMGESTRWRAGGHDMVKHPTDVPCLHGPFPYRPAVDLVN